MGERAVVVGRKEGIDACGEDIVNTRLGCRKCSLTERHVILYIDWVRVDLTRLGPEYGEKTRF
jgi:hypothetical protein